MGEHAKLSPSQAYRWIACPGSIRLTADLPETVSKYAAEGTEAHSVAQRALEEKTDAKHVTNNAEMAEAVQVYLDYVRALHCSDVLVEKRLKLTDDVWGTGDFVGRKDSCLSVVDYKHGAGVAVGVHGNAQLYIYGLAAALHFGIERRLSLVRLAIVQPRAPGEKIKHMVTTLETLILWFESVLTPAIEATKRPNAPLHAGDHCRFCKALATCPAQAANAEIVCKTALNEPALPAPKDLTPADIAMVLAASDRFSEWAKAVAVYAQRQVEGGAMAIPGYKLIKKRGNRAWVEGAEEKVTTTLGEDAYNKKLVSPAQAEKAGMDKNAVNDLCERPDRGYSLVKASHKGKEVVAPAAVELAKVNPLLM